MASLNDDSAAEKAQNNELSRMSNISSRLTYTETERLGARPRNVVHRVLFVVSVVGRKHEMGLL
jgi:hypothetical protein